MAAQPTPGLMTVEEYSALPERNDVILELHCGQLVELARPKLWHIDLQDRIADLLKARSGPDWKVRIEMPFSALPHYDLRCADVAMTAATRWDASVESYLQGSPEIVVEILSPSNRQREISEKIALCLSTGTQQFCVVDRDDRSVRVTGPDGKTLLYSGDDEIPFPLLEASLEVSEIWAD